MVSQDSPHVGSIYTLDGFVQHVGAPSVKPGQGSGFPGSGLITPPGSILIEKGEIGRNPDGAFLLTWT